MSWEDTFTSWAQGPSATETEKCENAESVIRSVIKNSKTLKDLPIKVFTQGSYKARTNVRHDSDVDVCVLFTNGFLYDLEPDLTPDPTSSYGPSSVSFPEYKNLIHAALVDSLGSAGVTRGNKAFDVHANTYRIDADVVPTFEYRYYFKSGGYRTGVAFLTDGGVKIFNYPDQTYTNGVAKNDRTGRSYKRVIRILKRLRNKMQEERVAAANDVGSFLIESLVWNAPDSAFGHSTYKDMVRSVLVHTFNNTIKDEDCNEWCEVNESKYLFRSNQPWTREKAHGFLSAAWDYIGYK